MSMIITYYNLTQCIKEDELSNVETGDIENGGSYFIVKNITRYVYFRSTDVEQHNYHRLLWSVPDEMLFFLSAGYSICVEDITSNTNGGKIKRIFCPVLSDTLNSIYFKHKLLYPSLISNTNMALDAIDKDKSLKTKLMFWAGKIKNKVNIYGISTIVGKEQNPLDIRSKYA